LLHLEVLLLADHLSDRPVADLVAFRVVPALDVSDPWVAISDVEDFPAAVSAAVPGMADSRDVVSQAAVSPVPVAAAVDGNCLISGYIGDHHDEQCVIQEEGRKTLFLI